MFWTYIGNLFVCFIILTLMLHGLCLIVGAKSFVPSMLKKIGKKLLDWLGKLLVWLLKLIGKGVAFPFRMLWTNLRIAAPILWRRLFHP
ncbi:hypothetical protein HZB94_04390 [Candidatus Falkowbacteria bacterium]|nr:hypothetical protein [Candidatus Falkowbacteria bacterium]